jgi:hypothetical protein
MGELAPIRPNPFGEWVKEVLQRHGLSFRGQRVRTGIDHVTVLTWTQGGKPSVEQVAQFALGLNENITEAMRLAGFSDLLGEIVIAARLAGLEDAEVQKRVEARESQLAELQTENRRLREGNRLMRDALFAQIKAGRDAQALILDLDNAGYLGKDAASVKAGEG